MPELEEIKTKEEAMRLIVMTLASGLAILSPGFHDAVALSERFDISVRDLLEWRRGKARKT